MGFCLPSAIGIQLGRPGELVIGIDGDGSFQMTLQDLATAVDLALPIKIFVLNNLFAKEGLKMRAIENALATQVAVEIPYDPFLYLKAVNEGIPVVRGAPRSAAAERLVRLAAVAFGEDTSSVAQAHEEQQKSRGRFGILRRA